MTRKLINFNTITLPELEKVPGIGKLKAQAVIDQRNVSYFKNVADLTKVDGLTEVFLTRLQNKYDFNFDLNQCKVNFLKRKPEKIDNQKIKDGIEATPEKKLKPKQNKHGISGGCSTSSPENTLCNRTIPSCDSPGKAVRSRLHSETAKPPDGLPNWLNKFNDWTRDERLIALNDLINLCDMSVVRHMMAKIEPHFQRDFISLLPKELALYVLSFLEPRDLSNAARTCRYWRILGEDNLYVFCFFY